MNANCFQFNQMGKIKKSGKKDIQPSEYSASGPLQDVEGNLHKNYWSLNHRKCFRLIVKIEKLVFVENFKENYE